jgi:hypothetical protein
LDTFMALCRGDHAAAADSLGESDTATLLARVVDA